MDFFGNMRFFGLATIAVRNATAGNLAEFQKCPLPPQDCFPSKGARNEPGFRQKRKSKRDAKTGISLDAREQPGSSGYTRATRKKEV
jgi:hypothetical protein